MICRCMHAMHTIGEVGVGGEWRQEEDGRCRRGRAHRAAAIADDAAGAPGLELKSKFFHCCTMYMYQSACCYFEWAVAISDVYELQYENDQRI